MKHGLAGVRGHLGVVDLGLVANDIAGEQLGETGVKAAQDVVLLVELAKQQGGLYAAHAQGAGFRYGRSPGAAGDSGGIRHGAGGDQLIVGLGVHGHGLLLGGGVGAGAAGRGIVVAAAGKAQACDGRSGGASGGQETAAGNVEGI